MGSLHPPDDWICAAPSTPGTDQEASWWKTYFDIDRDNFEPPGKLSIIMPPPPSSGGTRYMLGKPERALPGQRLKAHARWMNDSMLPIQSFFVIGLAFYEADGTYIGQVERNSSGFGTPALENIWVTMTEEACVDDYTDAYFVRLFIGRQQSTGTDSNTLRCALADLVVEPVFQSLTRLTTQSLSSGSQLISLTAINVNAAGVYLASGALLFDEGGTFVAHADAEITMSAGQSTRLFLQKTDLGGSTSDVGYGPEMNIITGNTSMYTEVNGVFRIHAGETLALRANSSSSATVNSARISLVRVPG